MNSNVKSILCASLLVIFCNVVHAEIAVIVNLANTDAIKKESIASLYLAKTRTFPGGTNAIPLDRPEGSPIRVEFVSKVIEKDESQMKSYWSRLIFTGAVGLIFFAEIPDVWTLAGAGLIVASTIYLARREARLGVKPAKPEAAADS